VFEFRNNYCSLHPDRPVGYLPPLFFFSVFLFSFFSLQLLGQFRLLALELHYGVIKPHFIRHLNQMGDRGDADDAIGGEVLQVFIRVRPRIPRDINIEKAVSVPDNQSISVRSDRYDVTCKYNMVFDDASKQADVFSSVKPLLTSVLKGYNACIFAYGQTSAGKSHTMLGPGGGSQAFDKGNKSEWGLIPRAVEHIFSELHRAADDGYLTYKVKASFVQVYNENLYDLLKDPKTVASDEGTSSFGRGGDGGGLKIREVPKPYVRNGAQQYEVSE
jgi:Kinesin motor domain